MLKSKDEIVAFGPPRVGMEIDDAGTREKVYLERKE